MMIFLVISVPVDKIRVGRDYQAVCPELQPEAQRKPELLADRALLVWSPTETIPETKCKYSTFKLYPINLINLTILFYCLINYSGGLHCPCQRQIWIQWGTGIGYALLA